MECLGLFRRHKGEGHRGSVFLNSHLSQAMHYDMSKANEIKVDSLKKKRRRRESHTYQANQSLYVVANRLLSLQKLGSDAMRTRRVQRTVSAL